MEWYCLAHVHCLLSMTRLAPPCYSPGPGVAPSGLGSLCREDCRVLSIDSPVDGHCMLPSLGLWRVKLPEHLWTDLCMDLFPFLLGRYLGVELPGVTVSLFSFEKLSNCFAKWL